VCQRWNTGLPFALISAIGQLAHGSSKPRSFAKHLLLIARFQELLMPGESRSLCSSTL